MRRILDRYIFREIASTWLGVTMVLLLILLTNQFARVLGDVAKGKLRAATVSGSSPPLRKCNCGGNDGYSRITHLQRAGVRVFL